MTDYSTMTDDEFLPIHAAVVAEFNRRQTIQQATDQMDVINGGVQAALGRAPGDEWVQPTGAHDAYPRWWEVTYEGTLYTSLIPANTTTPGSDPRWWKDLTPVEEPDDPDAPPQWSGDYVVYASGDLVTHEGTTYRVRQAHTSQPGWTPPAAPALFEAVTLDSAGAVAPLP